MCHLRCTVYTVASHDQIKEETNPLRPSYLPIGRKPLRGLRYRRENDMVNIKGTRAMGWIPDYPDFRDYTEKTEEVRLALGSAAMSKGKSLAASVDLREWCSPIEDQGNLGSCTAAHSQQFGSIIRYSWRGCIHTYSQWY